MEIIAQPRTLLGKKTKKLRQDRKIPAVMYGGDIESFPIVVDFVNFNHVFAEAGETSVIDLAIGDRKESVLVKDIQRDPVSGNIIHVGFIKVDLTEKIEAQIPVEVIGEEENALVKSGDALVLTVLGEITVEALPTDLPQAFVVDVSNLKEIGDVITVAQLEYDREKVEIVGQEDDEPVVKLDSAVYEEEVEEEEVTEEELIEGVTATEETAEEAEGEGAAEATE